MTPEPRLRADARRNRDQIIAAAKLVFAERGSEPPMEDIARRAGVGIGTLYRRFPDREALILAVARENFATLAADARAAIASEPTSWDALVLVMKRSRELRLIMRLVLQLPSVWQVVHEDPQIVQTRAEIFSLLGELVRGAQEEGVLRRDVGAGDVALLASLLLKQGRLGGDEAMERALVVILDGLRVTPGSPLPGRVLDLTDLGR